MEEVDQDSCGWKCFTAILTESELEVKEQELMEFAKNDLKLHQSYLDSEFRKQLPLALVVVMNRWAGWKRKKDYLDGKLTKTQFYNMFKKFMEDKASEVLNLEREEQNLEFAEFALSVQCPAKLINTIAFLGAGDNVILKYHMGKPVPPTMSMVQLIHWPFVEVTFQTEDMCFKRRQANETLRYLNIYPHKLAEPDKKVVEDVQKIDDQPKVCHSRKLIAAYITEYITAIKSIGKVDPQRITEAFLLLHHFLEDIKSMNINDAFISNHRVLFKLTPMIYICNKKISAQRRPKRPHDVGYCEVVSPKMELHLKYFKAKQVEGKGIKFESTERMKGSQDVAAPVIIFKCTFCDLEFAGGDTKEKMVTHLNTHHKLEQRLHCTACKKTFEVPFLAMHRWQHVCESVS